MGNIWFEEEEGQFLEERYTLAISRVKEILQEQRVPADFVSYFHETARFLLLCDEVKTCLETGVYDSDPERMRTDNHALYQDILPEHYDKSYANPAWACRKLGTEMGKLLCFLYAQERGLIAYIFEGKLEEAAAVRIRLQAKHSAASERRRWRQFAMPCTGLRATTRT